MTTALLSLCKILEKNHSMKACYNIQPFNICILHYGCKLQLPTRSYFKGNLKQQWHCFQWPYQAYIHQTPQSTS